MQESRHSQGYIVQLKGQIRRDGKNSYIERFNGSYRRAVLDAYIFRNLDEVRETTEKWMNYYNAERPHDALDDMAPLQYREFLLSGS